MVMMAATFSAVSEIFAEQLLLCLAGGTAVVMLAWALLRVTAGQNAGMRFRVWFSALLAIAALFMLGGVHPNAASGSATAGAHAVFEVPAAWAAYAFMAWLAVVALALMRIVVGLWQVWRLRRSCVEIDAGSLQPELMEWLKAGSKRRVALCVSERVSAPTAVGLGRPAIVLPTWVVRELSSAELKQVVLHEAAHLQRWDDWTNLAQKVLKAMLVFHPLAWWLESRLTLEREMACDDEVLRHTGNAGAYARCLATLAEKSFARRSMAMTQAAVSRVKQTSMRVARILQVKTPAATRAWASGVSLAAVFGFAVLVLSHTPNLIGFESGSAPAFRSRAAMPLELDRPNVAGQHAAVAREVALRPVEATGASTVATQHVVFAKGARLGKGRESLAQSASHLRAATRPEPPARLMEARYVAHDDLGNKPMLASAKTQAAQSGVQNSGEYVERAVFVVMQGDASGAPAVWQVTVWRVTVSQTSTPVRNELTPKKT
jgi:beta-lactamase regulating signal transducer with metallopeptidase domain